MHFQLLNRERVRMTAGLPTKASEDIDLIAIFSHRQTCSPINIDRWLGAWVSKHSPWIREWSGGRNEELDFSSDFSGYPEVILDAANTLSILFRVRAGSTQWKNWLSRVSHDLVIALGDGAKLVSCQPKEKNSVDESD